MAGRTFKVILIKPSHYDADGYVIQWWRSTIPSNSLASVYGLMAECAGCEVARADDVDIDIEAYDECNTVIDVKGAIRKIRAADAGFVGLVGVQSNQFPRALDLARAVPRRRGSGGDRRLPRQRLPLDAAGTAGRSESGARSRRHPVRRRRRGPHGRAAARHRRRQDQADLQLSERHAGDGGGDAADPAALGGDPRRRALYQLRCRPRLSVPVQLLHHHQRAGPQVALPHARRRRGHRARQCRAGHHPLLRHRRQFRAQQATGSRSSTA